MDLMQVYNQHERIEQTLAGCQKIMSPDLVKFVSNRELGSCIAYSDISPVALAQRIKSEIDYFKQLKLSFKWNTYSTDSPSNLDETLLESGFIPEETSSFMVLDLSAIDGPFSDTQMCIEVSDKQGIQDAVRVQKRVWGSDCQIQASDLIRLKAESPDQIHVYVIYQDNKPVSSAWLMHNPNSPFASIWAGSTLKEYRGKGCYSDLLTKRIQDAKARSLQYLTIHASKMSKPIVEKYGFNCIAQAITYRYQANL